MQSNVDRAWAHSGGLGKTGSRKDEFDRLETSTKCGLCKAGALARLISFSYTHPNRTMTEGNMKNKTESNVCVFVALKFGRCPPQDIGVYDLPERTPQNVWLKCKRKCSVHPCCPCNRAEDGVLYNTEVFVRKD